MVERTEYARE